MSNEKVAADILCSMRSQKQLSGVSKQGHENSYVQDKRKKPFEITLWQTQRMRDQTMTRQSLPIPFTSLIMAKHFAEYQCRTPSNILQAKIEWQRHVEQRSLIVLDNEYKMFIKTMSIGSRVASKGC